MSPMISNAVNLPCRLKFTISLRYVPVTQHFDIHCSQMMTHLLFGVKHLNAETVGSPAMKFIIQDHQVRRGQYIGL